MTTSNNQQMELGFGAQNARSSSRRQRRMAGSAWWFAQMRAVVDRAIDWSKCPPGRPEQISMTLAHHNR